MYDAMTGSQMSYLKGEMILSCLSQEQQKMQYISSPPADNEGVITRISPNEYMCTPATLKDENQPLWQVVQQLNFRVGHPDFSCACVAADFS